MSSITKDMNRKSLFKHNNGQMKHGTLSTLCSVQLFLLQKLKFLDTIHKLSVLYKFILESSFLNVALSDQIANMI